MKPGLNWTSTARRFTTDERPVGSGKSRGRGHQIGSPLPVRDAGARWSMVGVSAFALVLLLAIDGFLALIWGVALGPFMVGVTFMISGMGGRRWQHGVAVVYALLVAMLLLLAVALY